MIRRRLLIKCAVIAAICVLAAGCLRWLPWTSSPSLSARAAAPPTTEPAASNPPVQSAEIADGNSETTATDDPAASKPPGSPKVLLTASPRRGNNPIDGARSYEYLKQLCALGPRASGSRGMAAQQKLLADHFEKLGAKIHWQKFTIRDPRSGQPVEIANLLVEWHPERKDRILLMTHYDTRPFPDRDPNPRKAVSGTFIGANDGGSGTAVLMELAHYMPDLKGPYGVDFLFLDAEELVYEEKRDRYFIGSEYFARDYVANPPAYRYKWGVLLDMVGDRQLQLYQEKNSAWWDDTRPLVEEIWGTAHRLGVREFIPQRRYEVSDDHQMLHNIARIPTCDIIDFDYPVGPGGRFWHTEADTPDKCSADSLAKVGWVMLEWLQTTR
ncbi:MAG: M28 family peptidase [Planctomycetia bacterium]|nr:M28 family peptidase [Planctomycetia bacterium]